MTGEGALRGKEGLGEQVGPPGRAVVHETTVRKDIAVVRTEIDIPGSIELNRVPSRAKAGTHAYHGDLANNWEKRGETHRRQNRSGTEWCGTAGEAVGRARWEIGKPGKEPTIDVGSWGA